MGSYVPWRGIIMRLRVSVILLVSVFLSSCERSCGYDVFSGFAQGGEYVVKANMKGVGASHETVAAAIDSLLEGIDFSLSGYNRNSLLTKFNAGEEVVPDRYFSEILELSELYFEESGGCFDVWSGPLFDIWGFGFRSDSLPSASLVREAMALSKERKILNVNAIAQGYSCDVIAGYLHSLGVHDMLVNIGEIYCEGVNPSGQSWTIGVDNPVDGNNNPGADLKGIWESEGRACGIVTSGNYRKYYMKDGRKYAHTLDPRTGYPVDHGLLSATIVAPTAAEADAFATACMVMGTEDAKAFILSRDDIEGYLISSDGLWHSPGFKLRDE